MGALETVLLVVNLAEKYLPAAIKAGTNLLPFAEDLFAQISGRALTDDERTQLRARVDAAYERAVKPLSPPQPGDPDYVKDTE